MAELPEPDPTQASVPAPDAPVPSSQDARFQVRLDNFTGPFDLLLQLISKHQLDITEVALGRVTDEFIAYVKGLDEDRFDLDEVSSFLLVASTLLDLKAARLLPSGEVEDAEDLALLEARDLLFARLLQYRAFKDVSAAFAERIASAGRRVARSAPLEDHLVGLLPELVMAVTPDQLAQLAAKALTPRPEPPGVRLDHLHAPPVSVAEQAQVMVTRLRRARALTFQDLVADADNTLVVVARFLALLELFREKVVGFDQVEALRSLTVRWTGPDEGEVDVSDEYAEQDDAQQESQHEEPQHEEARG